MASSRFFVTNLPADTTEDELRELFKNYGPITLVELKTKENVLEPGNVNVFAFVTLQISADDAQYYLNELKWQKLRGAKIRISLAKESFLERLKRERAENELKNDSTFNSQLPIEKTGEKYNDYVPENLQNTRRVFNVDEDIIDDDIDANLLITKKRAGRSLQNGKIVIEESAAAPLHIIENSKKLKSSVFTTAEQKRKESLNKMKTQYDQKKNLIQSALSGINGSSAKKIKFSDAEDDDEVTIEKTKTKTQIFGSDNEAGDEDISALNLQYGKKGEKLAKLQSEHQSLDSRFKLDAKFVDDNGDNENDNESEVENEDDERKWQLNILEQVVGYKLDTDTQAQKAAKNKKMTRFDPSKAEHEKFLRQPTTENIPEKERKKKEKLSNEITSEEVSKTETEVHAVSKEVFYVVSNTLTEALKSRGEGFSLLNMFGQEAAELEEREDQLNQLKDERILVNNKLNKNANAVLNYESSSSGEDIDEEESSNPKSKNDSRTIKTANAKQHKSGKKSKVILTETFFIFKGDERLREGANFFHYDKSNQIPEEDYEPVRKRLNKLIKKKIIKTKKNMINAGRKVKRNKRRV